jgi:hypothetical protein
VQALELEKMSPMEFAVAVNAALGSGMDETPRAPLTRALHDVIGGTAAFVQPPVVESSLGDAPRSFPLHAVAAGRLAPVLVYPCALVRLLQAGSTWLPLTGHHTPLRLCDYMSVSQGRCLLFFVMMSVGTPGGCLSDREWDDDWLVGACGVAVVFFCFCFFLTVLTRMLHHDDVGWVLLFPLAALVQVREAEAGFDWRRCACGASTGWARRQSRLWGRACSGNRVGRRGGVRNGHWRYWLLGGTFPFTYRIKFHGSPF